MVAIVLFLLLLLSMKLGRNRYWNIPLCFLLLVALSLELPVWTLELVPLIALCVAAFWIVATVQTTLCVAVGAWKNRRLEGPNGYNRLGLILGVALVVLELLGTLCVVGDLWGLFPEGVDAGWFLVLVCPHIVYLPLYFMGFLVYTRWAESLPRRRALNAIVIYGEGLMEGEERTRLLELRLDWALELYRKGRVQPALIPVGETPQETASMTWYLSQHGTAAEHLLPLEGSCTMESLQALLDMLPDRPRLALISGRTSVFQRTHGLRAIGIRCLGIAAPVPHDGMAFSMFCSFVDIHRQRYGVVLGLMWVVTLVLPQVLLWLMS